MAALTRPAHNRRTTGGDPSNRCQGNRNTHHASPSKCRRGISKSLPFGSPPEVRDIDPPVPWDSITVSDRPRSPVIGYSRSPLRAVPIHARIRRALCPLVARATWVTRRGEARQLQGGILFCRTPPVVPCASVARPSGRTVWALCEAVV